MNLDARMSITAVLTACLWMFLGTVGAIELGSGGVALWCAAVVGWLYVMAVE